MDLLPNTPAALLNAFRTHNPTSPRLSWYGPDSERVEFSGRVLENWVAKTANYLVDELDAEPGTVVALDLPLHWRSMVWLLATWAVGSTAVTADAGTGTPDTGTPGVGTPADLLANADIVATTDPAAAYQTLGAAKPAPLVVAVALPALQMRWIGELPPRTLDYSGDVRAHADVFFADDEPAATDLAWRHESAATSSATSYASLLAGLTPTGLPEAPQRVLLQVQDGWNAVVPAALKAWATGGSVVLLDTAVQPTDRLRSSENITLG